MFNFVPLHAAPLDDTGAFQLRMTASCSKRRPLIGHGLSDLKRDRAANPVALEDRVDGLHIGDCVRPGCGHFSVLQDGVAVNLTLPGVLVGGPQDDLLDLLRPLVPYFAGPVGGSIEGDLDLHPAPVPTMLTRW